MHPLMGHGLYARTKGKRGDPRSVVRASQATHNQAASAAPTDARAVHRVERAIAVSLRACRNRAWRLREGWSARVILLRIVVSDIWKTRAAAGARRPSIIACKTWATRAAGTLSLERGV